MPIVTALIALAPVLLQIEGGAAQFIALLASLHAGGALTDEQVNQVRADAALADADYDAALAAAKARLAKQA